MLWHQQQLSVTPVIFSYPACTTSSAYTKQTFGVSHCCISVRDILRILFRTLLKTVSSTTYIQRVHKNLLYILRVPFFKALSSSLLLKRMITRGLKIQLTETHKRARIYNTIYTRTLFFASSPSFISFLDTTMM